MTIDELRPPGAPEDDVSVEHSLDDRFDIPAWLPRFLFQRRGPHRPLLRLAPPKAARIWRVLLPVNLVLWFVLFRLNAALELLHLPGKAGGGIGALASPSGSTVVKQWNTAAAELRGADVLGAWISGVSLASLYAGVGIIFSAAWPVALALAAVWLCHRIEQTEDRRHAEDSRRAAAVRSMLGAVVFIVPYTILFGVAQNTLRIAVVHWDGSGATLLRWVTNFHQGMVLAGVIPLIVALALLRSSPSPAVRGFLRGLGLVGIHLLTVVTFAVLLLVVSTKDQAQDVLRGWPSHLWWAVWGTVAIVVFAGATGASAGRVLAMSRNRRRRPPAPRRLMLVGAGVTVAGGVLLVGWDVGGVGIVVAGVGIAAIGFFSLFIQGSGQEQARHSTAARPTTDTEREDDDEVAGWPALGGLLAAAPLATVGLATLAALIPELLGTGPRPALLPVMTVVLFGFAIEAYRLGKAHVQIPPAGSEARLLTGRLFKAVLAPGFLFGLVFMICILADPLRTGRSVGTIAVVGFFLAGFMVVVMLVSTITHRYSPPAALAVLGFRRIPTVLLVVIWGVVGVAADGGSPVHDVRLLEGGPARSTLSLLPDLGNYTNQWLSDRATVLGIPAQNGSRRAIPLVLVSTAGGGIKAATWTALVVHCAFDAAVESECGEVPTGDPSTDPWTSVFAVSGASGGTVGLASALAERLGNDRNPNWVTNRLETDFASASIGWHLFAETPLTLFRLRPGQDRATVLEKAWANRWANVQCSANHALGNPTEQGLFTLSGPQATKASACGPRLPLFFANGTSLKDGCRFNASVLDGAPPPAGAEEPVDCKVVADPSSQDHFAATRDLTDFLCNDEDVRLSTVAFLSARFPYVSPTGRLAGPTERGRGDDEKACRDVPDQPGKVFVGDGGYRDNTGSSTLLELWDGVEPTVDRWNRQDGPCVVPIFVRIDSGYDNRSAPKTSGRLFEAIGPITGALSVFGARDVAGPQLARYRFDEHFFSFSLSAHPAVQAPLGWSLSESAATDIKRQLKRQKANQSELQRLRALLQPGALSCPGG